MRLVCVDKIRGTACLTGNGVLLEFSAMIPFEGKVKSCDLQQYCRRFVGREDREDRTNK